MSSQLVEPHNGSVPIHHNGNGNNGEGHLSDDKRNTKNLPVQFLKEDFDLISSVSKIAGFKSVEDFIINAVNRETKRLQELFLSALNPPSANDVKKRSKE